MQQPSKLLIQVRFLVAGPRNSSICNLAADATAEGITVYKHPTPMDPLDPFKRWYRGLWPAQRVGVWICAAVLVYVAIKWVTI